MSFKEDFSHFPKSYFIFLTHVKWVLPNTKHEQRVKLYHHHKLSDCGARLGNQMCSTQRSVNLVRVRKIVLLMHGCLRSEIIYVKHSHLVMFGHFSIVLTSNQTVCRLFLISNQTTVVWVYFVFFTNPCFLPWQSVEISI